MEIALKPYLGNQSLAKYERTINMVTKKLVEKLKQEVLKILVYPNLDDEVLTFLNHVEYNIGGSGTGTATAGTPVTENGTSQAGMVTKPIQICTPPYLDRFEHSGADNINRYL